MQKLSKILCGLALTTVVSAYSASLDFASSDLTLTTVEDQSATASVSINGVAPKSISTSPEDPMFTVSGQNITFNIPGEYRFRPGRIEGFTITAKDSADQSMTRNLIVEIQPIGFFRGLWKSVWDPAWGVSKVIYEVQHSSIFQRGFFWSSSEPKKVN